MSQTETMEKEFTETELAGGESLVEDEDLTDEEYVEALGEHDEDGNEIVSDKPKKLKSPLTSPVHHKKKDDDKDVKNSKNIEKPTDEVKDKKVAVSSGSSVAAFDATTTATATDSPVVDGDDKEIKEDGTSEKDKVTDIVKDDKECTSGDNNQIDDKEPNEGERNGDIDEVDDELRGGDIEREEDDEDEDERDEDGESIEDGQDADGQENSELSKANKELDDDEDRRNPQYIPKRGAFYEHDDRLGTDEEEDEEEEPEKDEAASVEKKPDAPVVEVRKAKKLWSDDAKWGHDMFDDEEQRPKPRDEIVSTYGYDIRNEDGPPKARRRRRYGRGPNRYTRSWKDEGAYSKPNDVPPREKTKSDAENPKKDKESNRPFPNKDDEPAGISKRSGPKGQQQRRTEVKSVALEGNDRMDRSERIERPDRVDRTERIERSDRMDRMDRKKPPREREGRDVGGQHRDNDRYRDRRRNGPDNRSPGPSKDLREFINSKNERLSDRRDDPRRNQSDFFENDFPELPQKSKDKMTRPQQHHQQMHQPQTTTTATDSNQPNAWSKMRPKHNDARETLRGVESSLDYKTGPTRMAEPPDNGKSRSFNLPETNPKIEIVKTQTFENSRYFNRRPLTKGGSHHQEPSNTFKKDLPMNRNNRGRTRPTAERDFRSSGEVGRPITKTSHLADDHDESGGSGSNMEQQRRNRYNVNKERDFRSIHHGSDDRDRRGPEVDPRGRNYLHDDRHYDNQFNDNQTDLSAGLNKLTLMDKSNNRLSSEANDSLNLAKPKRYSSLRQHQAQQQQQPQSEPLSQHKPPQPNPNQQPPQSAREAHQANSNLPQYPSTSQHLNLNHPRQSTNVQYYEAAAGAAPQPPPPPPPSASYYIDNRSPQSSFGYIPTTNIEGGPAATRFLSQIAPRFIPPPTAPPPTAPEPRFMAQAVAAANPAAAAGPLPPVIPGPPTATYLPTYPPGYPQYPPPPPPTAAQFSIAPPPPPPPSAAEMYRGGVTYYDTMTQQVSPRQLPQRRPKNALPIVPPPDLGNNPDGMVMNQGYEVDENDLNQNIETITC